MTKVSILSMRQNNHWYFRPSKHISQKKDIVGRTKYIRAFK